MGTTRKIKIGLVGPMTPFRGGISHHTTQLYQALSSRGVEVAAVSFKRQYPQWLYPGQGDTEADAKPMPKVKYIIDAYSLPSWRRAADSLVSQGCNVVVLTWWTLFWQPGFAYIARRLRKAGVKTVFMCHNVKDHKISGIKGAITAGLKVVSRWLLRQADGYIVHSTEQAEVLRHLRQGAPVLNRLHPIYDRFPKPVKRLPKRGRLELLFFGFIRPYKGLDYLLEALAKLGDHKVYLTIAGEAWGDADELLNRIKQSGAPNIEAHIKYISDQAAADYFARADVIVSPYVEATGSGPTAIAYHYGKPVLATRVGGLAEAVLNGKTGWLVDPLSSEKLAKAISGIERGQAKALEPNIRRFCRQNSWDTMADEVIEFAGEIAATS